MANGTYNNSELVDTIIVDLNNILCKVVSGQYIQACSIVTQVAQKLVNLRQSIDSDIESKNKKIEMLKQALKDANCEVEDVAPEDFVAQLKKIEGENNGCE